MISISAKNTQYSTETKSQRRTILKSSFIDQQLTQLWRIIRFRLFIIWLTILLGFRIILRHHGCLQGILQNYNQKESQLQSCWVVKSLFTNLIMSFGHKITQMMRIISDHTTVQYLTLEMLIQKFSMRKDSKTLEMMKTVAKYSKLTMQLIYSLN